MSDFCLREWEDLCQRTQRCAQHFSENSGRSAGQIEKECRDFCSQDAPKSYTDLLKRTAQARDLAVQWKEETAIFNEG